MAKLLSLSLLLIAFPAYASTESWVLVSASGVGAPLPREVGKFTLATPVPVTSGSATKGTYQIADDTLAAFLSAVCRCEMSYVSGTHAYEVVSGWDSQQKTVRTIVFSGPLGVLGTGRVQSTGNILAFTPSLSWTMGGTIIFARETKPTSLWTAATQRLRLHGASVTDEAADELWKVTTTGDITLEEDKASASVRAEAISTMNAFVDDLLGYAVVDGGRPIQVEDVSSTLRRWCPVYPICKKVRR